MTPERLDAYRRLRGLLDEWRPPESMDLRLEGFVEHAWRQLQPTGVSWLGFYHLDPSDSDAMVLGPRRDRPACSPIGLHGVCGQSLRSGRTRIVADVLELGDRYVACDPRDRSEVVIPLRLESGGPHPADTVLDLDSFEPGGFSDDDDHWLRECLIRAELPPLEVEAGRSGGPG